MQSDLLAITITLLLLVCASVLLMHLYWRCHPLAPSAVSTGHQRTRKTTAASRTCCSRTCVDVPLEIATSVGTLRTREPTSSMVAGLDKAVQSSINEAQSSISEGLEDALREAEAMLQATSHDTDVDAGMLVQRAAVQAEHLRSAAAEEATALHVRADSERAALEKRKGELLESRYRVQRAELLETRCAAARLALSLERRPTDKGADEGSAEWHAEMEAGIRREWVDCYRRVEAAAAAESDAIKSAATDAAARVVRDAERQAADVIICAQEAQVVQGTGYRVERQAAADAMICAQEARAATPQLCTELRTPGLRPHKARRWEGGELTVGTDRSDTTRQQRPCQEGKGPRGQGAKGARGQRLSQEESNNNSNNIIPGPTANRGLVVSSCASPASAGNDGTPGPPIRTSPSLHDPAESADPFPPHRRESSSSRGDTSAARHTCTHGVALSA